MKYTDTKLRPYVFIMLLLGAIIYGNTTGYYGNEILAEIAIYAILAMALDLVAGYAGMISLGHAGFFALGAYVTAALTVFFDWPVVAAMPLAILGAALLAFVTGIVVVRLTGVFFIMITLAVGQMVYSYLFKNRTFGGDDGMSGTPRLDLSWFNLNTDDPVVFSMLTVAFAVVVYLIFVVLSRSPYGHALIGIHQNENRMRALGCPVRLYKLAAFTASGAVAGLAGSLVAQLSGFISPELSFWTVSGELLIMVIVGGMGTFIGPIVGTAVVISLKHELSSMTEYWSFVMGIFFVAIVLFAEGGLYGLILRLRHLLFSRKRNATVAGEKT